MKISLPPGGEIATISTNDDGSISVGTPIGGEPPSGETVITYDPNVTRQAMANTVVALTQLLASMGA